MADTQAAYFARAGELQRDQPCGERNVESARTYRRVHDPTVARRGWAEQRLAARCRTTTR
jgi:hypothetical protein